MISSPRRPVPWRQPASKALIEPFTTWNGNKARPGDRPSTARAPAGRQFGGQFFGAINLIKRFKDRGRMDRGRAPLFLAKGVIPRQALQIAIKDDPDKLAGPIDDRAAGVAADDVAGADKIERRFEVQPRTGLDPARR